MSCSVFEKQELNSPQPDNDTACCFDTDDTGTSSSENNNDSAIEDSGIVEPNAPEPQEDSAGDTSEDGLDTAISEDPTPAWTLAPWLGIDGNAPIDSWGNTSVQFQNPSLIASSGAGWVRINFILGPWESPQDPNWIAKYRSILEPLVAEGIQIYGLIGAESVKSAHSVGSAEWLSEYVFNFVAIVGQMKDIVFVYESFNEPNNWDASAQPTLSPEEYALLLQEVYLEVKHHNGHMYDASWQVQLISGPLFTHDQDNGSEYLHATYEYGRNYLAWDWTYSEMNSYPLDGIGLHLYVQQGSIDNTNITNRLNANITAIQNVIDTWDASKKIWVSEIGWNSNDVGQNGQADALDYALHFIKNDTRIVFTSWFCLLDWPGVGWGIRNDAQSPKPAWTKFQEIANE